MIYGLSGVSSWSGAVPGFCRGGGGFSKIIRKFGRPFFWVDQIDFSSSPGALFCPCCFGQIFCAAGKMLNKKAKKAFSGTFWKSLTKKFLGALPLRN